MRQALWECTAVQLRQAIEARRVSCVEVTEQVLERVERVNPAVNAIVDQNREQALEMALDADRHMAEGRPLGRLHGVPVTIKVNTDQQGKATTDGVTAFAQRLADHDSAVVANLRREGAILLGRTNTPAFSWRWFTDNELHGRTVNPLDASVTPGGSSGGAAVAVATGMGPVAHGTDAGGSIRYPAYACGVYGLRPTPGVVPVFNGTAKGERLPMSQMMSVQGPLARSVDDLALAFDVMAVGDPRDPLCLPARLRNPPLPPRLKIGLISQDVYAQPDCLVSESLQTASQTFREAGHDVQSIELPSLAEAALLWRSLLMNEAKDGMLAAIQSYGDAAIRHAVTSMMSLTPALDWQAHQQALGRRTAIMREWALLLSSFDVLLMPVSWQRPFDIGLDQQSVQQMEKILHAQSPLLALAVLGFPALSAPVKVAGHLCGGVQIVSGRYREDLCLHAAKVLEGGVGVAVVTPGL
ncbi:amidase [Alcaligenes phenolicus]|uniref:Amidase n=2 Tax=Pseudomonadota TaxID=1224 RepID=A0AAW5VVD0_9BURK|nr:amidase [Alcaligenes phenolicus]MCX5567101.1 amidase [Alcaligenes phenolicus]